MVAVLFDTLRLSRTLRDKGRFTPEQAEALAEALGEATHDDLATKTDLAAVKAELKADIAEVMSELKADIAGVRSELKADIAGLKIDLKDEIAGVKDDMHKWVVGALGFQTVVILGTLVSLIKILAK